MSMKFEIDLDNDHDIKIGVHTFHIKFVDGEHHRLDTNHDHGAYVDKEYTIYLRSTDPPSIKLSSLLHELMHAFEHIYTFELDHMHLNLVADLSAQVLLANYNVEEKKKKKK